jgi:hypothetical protein
LAEITEHSFHLNYNVNVLGTDSRTCGAQVIAVVC